MTTTIRFCYLRERMRWPALILGLLLPQAAWAHGGEPAVAYLNEPQGVGNVVDDSFEFSWVDADRPIPTGTATVDFFYVRQRIPAFNNGEIHPDLVGDEIVTGLLEQDPTNRFTWDTRAVPAGSYMIWSRVTEPIEMIQSPQIIVFSPGVVTVAHPGDPVYPAIHFTSPDSPFKFADQEFELGWQVMDPDGSGTISLEVGTSSRGRDFETLATLPATATTFLWDTRQVREGDWQLRATIRDGRGLSFTTYSQYRLLVTHIPGRDAGTVDQGGADSGEPPDSGSGGQDAGPSDVGLTDAGKGPPDSSGCSCSGQRPTSDSHWPLLMVLTVIAAVHVRRRRPQLNHERARP